MTPRLFILWLRLGGLALLCGLAAVMLFCLIAMACAMLGSHGPAQWRALLMLAGWFGWSSGAFLLTAAAWMVLESWCSAFAPGGAG